jgi:hypothetical protein
MWRPGQSVVLNIDPLPILPAIPWSQETGDDEYATRAVDLIETFTI